MARENTRMPLYRICYSVHLRYNFLRHWTPLVIAQDQYSHLVYPNIMPKITNLYKHESKITLVAKMCALSDALKGASSGLIILFFE